MRISDWSSDVCSSDLIEYDRKVNSRDGVAPGESHLDSIGESRGFDGWEIKIRDISDLRQFAPVHGRDRLTDCRRSEAAIIGKTIISRRRKNARTATLRCRRLLISAAFTRDDTQGID